MNLANAKHLTIGGKSVVRLSMGDGVVWKGLPQGYTKLDYIQATGTQYIDTGFKPNQDSRMVCECLYYGGTGVCGARNAVSNNNFSIRIIYEKWQFGHGDKVWSTDALADTEWHTHDLNSNKYYLDGTLIGEAEYESFTCSYPIAIGAIKAGSVYYGKGLYRDFKVYDNGVLVRDMIPCKDPNGNIGMYDTVNAVFYGNAGTGEFVAGEIADTTSELGVAVLGTMILGE